MHDSKIDQPDHDVSAPSLRNLDQILPALLPTLTEPERRALQAIREAHTLTEAANKSFMTSRDLRVRFARTATKAKQIIAEARLAED